MTLLLSEGVAYKKEDGECAHPMCRNKIDWKKHDKPPLSWGHVIFTRYGKKNEARVEFVVCPAHTLKIAPKQPTLATSARKLFRTIIESPLAGDIAKNLRYAREAMRHALHRGEAPLASHTLYTQEGVLDDNDPEERRLGIEAGFSWGEVAQKVAVYTDLGVTPGMQRGIEMAKERGLVIEMRQLGGWGNETNIEHE